MTHGLCAITATTAAWSWPSISVRYLSSAVLSFFLGARNRACTDSGESRANALASRRLSSARIGRTTSSVPSLSRYVESSMNPIVRATTRAVGDRGHAPAGSAALVDRHVVAAALARVDLARAGDLLLVVLDELEPLRDPAAGAGDGEHHREHRQGQGLRVVARARVEVGVE